jgi:hypothetical protein
MPNVTIFIPRDKMPEQQVLAEFTEDCTKLCTDVLKAALDKVHIIYVEILHGRGHSAYVEVKYRLETFRPPAVMNEFMAGVESALLNRAGLKARIRCFGYAAETIYAKN